MTNKKYILDGHKAIAVDLLTWANWVETTEDRHVADETIEGVRISTVFLGLDHSFRLGNKPLLFETMVFDGELDGDMERYSTWEEAEIGHKHMVDKVKKRLENR